VPWTCPKAPTLETKDSRVKKIKLYTPVVHLQMCDATKFGIQTRFVKIHMKIINSTCICTTWQNSSSSAYASVICYFHIWIFTKRVSISNFVTMRICRCTIGVRGFNFFLKKKLDKYWCVARKHNNGMVI
jgi:hypothetical protein